MSDTPEIAGAKRKLELQATELPNWARQLLDYIAQTEREFAGVEARDALEFVKHDLENCDWQCARCGADYGMKETDIYVMVRDTLNKLPLQDSRK